MELQLQLLDVDKANTDVEESFLRKLSDLAGSQWPSLASLLSYTSAQIEESLTGDTPALSLLLQWKMEKCPTYGYLLSLLRASFMLPSYFTRTGNLKLRQSSTETEDRETQWLSNVGTSVSYTVV